MLNKFWKTKVSINDFFSLKSHFWYQNFFNSIYHLYVIRILFGAK